MDCKWSFSGTFISSNQKIREPEATKTFETRSFSPQNMYHRDMIGPLLDYHLWVSIRLPLIESTSLKNYQQQQKNSNDVNVFWCLYCQLWTHFTPFSNVSIVDFEQAQVCWIILENNLKPKMNILSIKLLQINTIVLFPRANNCDMWAINFDLASISSRVPNLKIIATTYRICSRT